MARRGCLAVGCVLLGMSALLCSGCQKRQGADSGKWPVVAAHDPAAAEKGHAMARNLKMGMKYEDVKKLLGEGDIWMDVGIPGKERFQAIYAEYDLTLSFGDQGQLVRISCGKEELARDHAYLGY
jgi:hypothetical protein